jgi:fructose-1,6-bisphosphatase II
MIMSTGPKAIGDIEPEKLIGLDLLRACEAAALNTFKWIGIGDALAADAAATDAIRGMLRLVDMRATCSIGEGLKDNAPGIFVGERLGTGKSGSPSASIAVNPIDGTRLTARGLPGALSVIAAAKTSPPDERALAAVPGAYMEKTAVGPLVAEGGGQVRPDAPAAENLEIIAERLGKRVRDLVVCLLDRPRHEKLIEDIRRTGAAIRLISDGDVAGAIAASRPDSGVDAYMGTGGSPEAVLAAAAIKCMGGEILARTRPRDDEEKERLRQVGYGEEALGRLCTSADLARGEYFAFVATGITDNAMLQGVGVNGRTARTHSVVMRSSSRTIRYVTAFHDLTRKTIRVHSEPGDRPVSCLLPPSRRAGQMGREMRAADGESGLSFRTRGSPR